VTIDRPPPLVAAAAVLMTVVGVGWLIFAVARDMGWLWVGPVALAVAFGVWRGFSPARYAGLLLGAAALLPGAYGLWGTSVVVQDWLACDSGRLRAVATSYPSGYCETVNWLQSFGTGGLLMSVGLVGVVTLVALARHGEHFERGGRG
jgi:hypothetical protein